jgi:hypothetical protein
MASANVGARNRVEFVPSSFQFEAAGLAPLVLAIRGLRFPRFHPVVRGPLLGVELLRSGLEIA